MSEVASYLAIGNLEKGPGFRLYSSGGKEIPSQDVKPDDILKSFDEKEKEIDALIAPDGTRKFPAKTCYDLFLDHKDFKSGEYWIDPNGGTVKDAIFVYCDKKKNSSCVYPKNAKISDLILKKDYQSKDDKWLSEAFEKSEEVEYDAHYTQINFLRTLSNFANQNVTYSCRNSKAWKDGEHSIKLMGSNEMEYHATSKISLRPKVITNECTGGDKLDKWGKTVLEIDTRERSRLPIVDVSAFDVGGKDQDFKLEIGAACFHHTQ